MPQLATSDEQIDRCYAVMAELRPGVVRAGFVPLVRQMQSEGYHLAYIEAGGRVLAVAGYRISTNFFMGRHLYVEDLVTTASERGQGHGKTLLDWLLAQAGDAGCAFVDLDSGPQRGRAHKFYFSQGFTIAAYHFGLPLVDDR